MYDPVELTAQLEPKILRDGLAKKYYRFRGAKYYGGISTADVVGCNMHCVFCWVHPKVRSRIRGVGEFYTPAQVGERLVRIARNAGFKLIRVSGGEPTIGRAHLVSLLRYLNDFPFGFILETNGMLLSNENFVEELGGYDILHVRVALKAATPEMFSKVTKASLKAFYYPLQALKHLVKYKISCHASVIRDFCSAADLRFLQGELHKIDSELVDGLEYESLILYPHVKKGLRKSGFQV
jgi:uncharacterized Fe-S cluster-containing radical SAM superfamily protein